MSIHNTHEKRREVKVKRKEFTVTKKQLQYRKPSLEGLAYQIKRNIASFEELELCFVPIDKFPSSLFIKMFYDFYHAFEVRKINLHKVVLDNEKYSLSFLTIDNVPQLFSYVFLQVSNKNTCKWYYTNFKALAKFVKYLEKANNEGVDVWMAFEKHS